MDIYNARCRRGTINAEKAADERFMERKLISFMKRGTFVRCHVTPGAQANGTEAQRDDHRAKMPRIGYLQPADKTHGSHDEEQAEKREDEKNYGGA